MGLTFSLGSTSRLKVAAVRQALGELGIHAEVHAIPVSSGAPAQPVGVQTAIGAKNRALFAQRMSPGSWGIGIESGVFDSQFHWEDRAIVCLVAPNGADVWLTESEPLRLEVRDVEEARRRGFETTTVGAMLAHRTGGKSDDPHIHYTLQSRREYIRKAVIAAIRRSSLFPMHTVGVGSISLTLPVVSVSEGTSVALFNALGDWSMNEDIGYELSKLVPSTASAILMPDGKAQALLHVLGRETGLSTFVARKELKPYMRDVIIAEASSITNDGRRQRFYLDGPDAVRIRGRNIAVFDDVVSTGSTLDAMISIVKQAGAFHDSTIVVFTEGALPRADVVSLGHLPVFRDP